MRKIMIISISLVLICSGFIFANDLKGKDVLDKVEEAIGANNSHLNLTMILYNSSGNSRERTLEIYKKEGDKDRSLVKFLAPATVKGTTFLAIENNGDSDMYLYMPALGSERRIAGSQRNSSFVGSDFNYNDLAIIGGGNYNSDYQAKILEFKDLIYKLELKPTDEDIDYQYLYMWVNSEKWYPLKIEFYDSKGELNKILTTGLINEDDGYLFFQEILMEDIKKGGKTEILLNSVNYNLDLDDNLFTVRNMKR